MSKELKDVITQLNLTAVFKEAAAGGYIGYIAELPGANTQGETIDEVRENLSETVQMILAGDREASERCLAKGAKGRRERLALRAA